VTKGNNRLDACSLFLDDPLEGEQRKSRTFPVPLDNPSPHESLLSYIARVGTENGRHRLSQVLRISFPDRLPGSGLPFSGIDLEPLSRVLNVPLAVLRAKLYTGPGRVPFPRKVACLNGQEIPRKLLSTGHRRIAPRSVAEHGYHRSIWDVLPLTCCVETGEKLIDRCPCGKALMWWNNSLEHCGDPACRVDLRELTTSFVDPSQLHQIRFLGKLYSPDMQEQRAAKRQVPAELSDLSSAELLELIILFGVAHSDPIGKIARKRRPSLCNGNFISWTTEELAVGIEVVLGFPASFEKFLDMMIERAPERPGRGSLPKYVGVLTELTQQKPFSARVVSKFRSYIPDALNRRSNVTLNPRVKTSEPKYLDDTISISDACKKYGLTYKRIANLAKVPGLSRTLGRGHGIPVLLDAWQVDQIVKRFKDLVSVSHAARQMGLTLTNLQRLVSDGFLSYADGPEVEMCSRAKMRWKPASYIRHNEINALIESVEAKATRLKEPVRLVNGTVRMPDGAYMGLKAIIEGRITVGVDTKKLKPMQRLLVEESEFRSYVFSKVPHLADSDIISLQRAREILRLKCSVANELLEKSGVHIQRHQKKMSPKVKRFDVLRIAERYISGGDTAKLLGTLPRHVQRRVAHLGIRPVIILESRGAVFYNRQEIFRKCVHLFVETGACRAAITRERCRHGSRRKEEEAG
jgi:hypothetical protein